MGIASRFNSLAHILTFVCTHRGLFLIKLMGTDTATSDTFSQGKVSVITC